MTHPSHCSKFARQKHAGRREGRIDPQGQQRLTADTT